ncbi:hypothetical protein GIB67_013324 [Kingdonia uniflora]|uniref:Lipid-binding serum glycoprotein C-terminal domain-containing protein n=1 Tax=Kingdonia uniflora TaxID=39325 RepID=A0A7J7LQQ1_9MAGN|nr:hypothetical protein GIB67_013324 [Kingdonia uniflora]
MVSEALFISFILTSLFVVPTTTHNNNNDEGFISLLISQKGLNFTKDILISSLTPLQLPQITKSKKIPLVGDVEFTLSNITVYKVDVISSYVKSGDKGVAIAVLGATANISLCWGYSYSNWVFEVTDNGRAEVQYQKQVKEIIKRSKHLSGCLTTLYLVRLFDLIIGGKVEGMESGLTLGLENLEGTLKLFLIECSCYVKDITITLDGGASWLYQGLVDTFEEQIRSTIENGITNKIREGIIQLDSLLESLPQEIPVDDVAVLNVTFTNDPLLSDSSIEVEISGLFSSADKVVVPSYDHSISQPSFPCKGLEKMLEISLDEHVFNSGSETYFKAGLLQWIVNKVPDQHLLNTASWKYIVPQLYKKYPNYDMNLNISLSSPPVIRISSPHDIDATIYSDVTIDVLDFHETTPVACVSLVISASGSVKIRGNNLSGSLKLDGFTLSLKWSKIGNFHLHLIQSVTRTFIKTVALPYANLRLTKGFPLPILRGFTLQNAEILCSYSKILICSDVEFNRESDLMHLPLES